MTEESLRAQVDGYLLHRMVFHPSEGIPVRAEALFYHGQGDYAERYLDVLHPFTERGIRCTITELPGHGRSPGKRGHCGNTAFLDAVIQDSIKSMEKHYDSTCRLKYGVMGHSMGGLLAARHLVLAGREELPLPAFAWLSSPLLRPSNNRSVFFVRMLKFFAPLIPSLTVSTGVTPEMCRIKQDDVETTTGETQEPRHQLWHSRISLGWGAALLAFEQLLNDGIADIPVDTPLLYTQGAEDQICPPDLARGMYERFPNQLKRYGEMKGLLHEPFRGDGSDLLFIAIENWLDSLDLD